MDAMKVLKALCAKTEARGCTKDEAEQAQKMAASLAAKHGIDLAVVRRELELDGMSRRARMIASSPDLNRQTVVDFAEMMRKAREAAQNSRCYSEPIRCRHLRRWVVKNIPGTAFKCKTCFYQSDDWTIYQDLKAKNAKKDEYESVSHYVTSCLKYTDMSFQEIADGSRARFGGKTSKNSVAWYVNQLKKQGFDYSRMNKAGDIRRK
jgi:Protein of unknown function (DUF2786)